MNTRPLVSVITVVFNGEAHLEETIKSVLNQTYENIEYIIIDGGSTDGTLGIIKKYEDRITYWISESDEGISDAFNKGVKQSNGYVLMLNAGDIFKSQNIIQECSKDLTGDIISFEVLSIAGKKVGLAHYKEETDLRLARVPHQGTFVHKNFYTQHAGYSLAFKIRMDYEFFARSIKIVKPKLIKNTIVIYDNDGISSTLKNKFRFEMEGLIIEYLYFNKNILYLFTRSIYRVLKSIISSTLRNFGIRK